MKTRRRLGFVFALLLYVFFEGLCYVGLLVLETSFGLPYDPRMDSLSNEQRESLALFVESKKGRTVTQDPTLGWLPLFEGNSAGMRDDREYEKVPPLGTIRISAFGDSFTYGTDVELPDTWAKQLESKHPGLEVLNYGVGAYGLDQAYLRYLKVGTDYRPHIVFIGYMSENIGRHVNVFRPFYARSRKNIFSKPRFQFVDGKLVLLQNPLATVNDYEALLSHDREELMKLGMNDFYYQNNYGKGALDVVPSVRLAKIVWHAINTNILNPIFKRDGTYSEKSEAFQVTVRIVDAFYRQVLEDEALPIIVVFPDVHDQVRSRKGLVRRYTPLLKYAQSRGYRVIDALGALEPYESRYSVDDLSVKWGHYTPLGNRIVADYMSIYLDKSGVTSLSRLDDLVRAERRRIAVSPLVQPADR